MNKARKSFAKIDATNIDEESYTFNIGIDENGEGVEPDVSLTVEFEQVEADSAEELEQRLDDMAAQALQEAGESPAENKGYEVVREYGDTYREVGFVVTGPYL